MTRVIAVANQKGGVGKTTTAVNMAAYLSEARKRVLLVDLDPQANASSGLGLQRIEGSSLYAALLGESPASDKIRRTVMDRLDIIPSEVDLCGAEIDVARLDRHLFRLREALAPIVADEKYDYILVDCPPSLGILTMNALAAADTLFIPIQCEYYALEGLSIITHLIRQLRETGTNPGLELEGILMTMFDSRTNLSQQVVEEVKSHFGEAVFDCIIPRSVRLSESPSHGQPIILYDDNCPGAKAYRQAAREWIRREKQKAAASRAALAPVATPPPDTAAIAPEPTEPPAPQAAPA
ncbi:MAG: ParA family protein [Kiritimatiellia bacterium]